MPFDAFAVDQFGDLFDDAVARLLVRNFADQNPRSRALLFFDLALRADQDRAASGLVPAKDSRTTADDAAGRKVGTGNDLEKVVDGQFGVVDQRDHGVANFGRVVRRDAGRHADRDAAGPVDKQVRKLAGQHRRFGADFVIRRRVVDGVQFDIVQHRRGDRRQTSFRVPHRGRGQAGDAAEVALLVDQQPPHVPFLGHADQRRIDDRFAVRVIVAGRVAGDLRALDPLAAWAQVQVVHRDQDPPLGRFQSVANIGKGAADDDAHRVRQITVPQLVLDRLIDHAERASTGPGVIITAAGDVGRSVFWTTAFFFAVFFRFVFVSQGSDPGVELRKRPVDYQVHTAT